MSHSASAWPHAKGLSVGFTTAASLVSEMMEARDERRLLRFQKQMAAYQLVIIDELGFVPLSKTGAELLFELISQRYERGATLITSNLPFDGWTETWDPNVSPAHCSTALPTTSTSLR
jgi:DNA replication protein DnaC